MSTDSQSEVVPQSSGASNLQPNNSIKAAPLPTELRRTSEEKGAQLVMRQVTVSKTHCGPLPSPEDLESYVRLIPNGGERIMALTEKQAEHRIGIEKQVIGSQQVQSERGQFFAFFLALAGLGTATYLAMNGHDWVAGILAGTTLVSLVSVFLLGKSQQRQSLQEKRPIKPAEAQEKNSE